MGLPAPEEELGKIVIVETGGGQAGVVVGDVEEVLTVTEDQLEDIPTTGNDAINSIAKIGDRLVVLLDPQGLFASAQIDDAVAAAA
jgi:purine-binding chemotaxis protein CheW